MTGGCTSCWQGYTLIGSICDVITPVASAPEVAGDIYCIKVSNGACVECSNGFYLNKQERMCKQLDPICRDHNLDTGACTDCYNGYTLMNSRCVVAAQVQIANCINVTPAGFCSQCIEGYYLKDGDCAVVSILCDDYNRQTGECVTCIANHVLQDRQCIYPAIYDINCVHYSSAYCDTCRIGFYLSNYMCVEVDPNCLDFNYDEKECESCRGGLIPEGPSCV